MTVGRCDGTRLDFLVVGLEIGGDRGIWPRSAAPLLPSRNRQTS